LAVWNFYLRPAFEPASEERMAFPLPEKPSIAVLPFDNLSGDPNQEYLSDGLTEEIITALSRVPRLFVIARNSTFTYKGKPVEIKQVAEKFGVRYVLEGSIRKSEDRLRITARLIDAIKGHHLWTERYDRDLKDLFAVQDEITMKIITALQVKLTRGDAERLYAKGTDNLEAYLKCLQSRELSSGAVTKETNALARRLAKEAIAVDPKYAGGYRALAETHSLDVWLGISKSPRESLKRGVDLAQKAIALDHSNAHAHSLLSSIYVMQRQHDKAIAAAERAYALEPNSSVVLGRYAWVLYYSGRWEEAVQLWEEGMRLSPIPSNAALRFYGAALRELERYDEAIAVFKRAIEQDSKDFFAYLMLSVTYTLAGREEEARETAEEVLRINPKFSVEHLEKTTPFKNPSHTARLTNAMRKAGLPDKPPLPLPDKPSIAVLPFVNMSGDPEQEYFSDGITESIITALSKVEKLFVIARNSTFTYKGKPVKVQQVARDLGVQYVLEGSVQKYADRIRITAQLIDAPKGHHLWAERYDRDLKDLFDLQDEITMKIITALEVKLTEGEQALVAGSGTDNLDAYLKILQARDLKRHQTIESNHKARRLVEEAIELDPDYAQAYRWLSGTHLVDVWLGSTKSPQESLRTAVELAKKALSLDDSLGGAHGLLGNLYVMTRQYEKGIREAERAVELEPNGADAHMFLGMALRFAGRAEEAIPILKKAIRLDPHAPGFYLNVLAGAYRETGKYEEAIVWCEKAVQQNAKNVLFRVTLCSVYSLTGRMDEARAQAKEIMRLNPNFSVERFARTDPQKNEVVKKRYIDALRRAGLK
jgi:TolB-like protein/Flp pilus assembly protein TadD